jgi:hypothetical protein
MIDSKLFPLLLHGITEIQVENGKEKKKTRAENDLIG